MSHAKRTGALIDRKAKRPKPTKRSGLATMITPLITGSRSSQWGNVVK